MEEEGEQGRRWEELGLDCLVNVFAKLGLEEKTLGVPFVCKSWHQASMDPLAWKVINFREVDLMPRSNKFNARFAAEYRLLRFSFTGFLKLVLRRSRGLAAEIAFPAALAVSLKDLDLASNECPRVKVLVLPNAMYQDEKQIPGIISKWQHLEHLEIGLKPQSLPQMLSHISLHCKQLVGLQMQGCFTKDDAKAIIKRLPKLKNLVMSQSYLRKEELMIIMDGLKDLEALDVSKCRGFDPDDEVIKKATRIKVFKHEGTKLKDDYYNFFDVCYEYEDVHWAMFFGG